MLRKLGVAEVWAKAVSSPQSEILAQVGVAHVVRPEHEMGQRVAHLVRRRMRDYIEFDDGNAVARTVPPRSLLGRTLADAAVRSRFGVTVVGIKPSERTSPPPDRSQSSTTATWSWSAEIDAPSSGFGPAVADSQTTRPALHNAP